MPGVRLGQETSSLTGYVLMRDITSQSEFVVNCNDFLIITITCWYCWENENFQPLPYIAFEFITSWRIERTPVWQTFENKFGKKNKLKKMENIDEI